jgi:muramoyltetrapeptide carboxypeptidase LdcA involved in peptidoglycan recycling
MSYRDCILEAKKVLDFVKFNVKLDYQMRPENDGSGSAWGQQQRNNSLYKAVIRCVPTEKMVFFVVGGYNPNKVREYINILLDNFQVSSTD